MHTHLIYNLLSDVRNGTKCIWLTIWDRSSVWETGTMPRNTPRMRGCTSMQKKLVLQKHQEMKRGRFLIGIFTYLN